MSGQSHKTKEMKGPSDTSSVPSTIEYPENNSADLVVLDDSSWCCLSDSSKLASNASSFSFVVNVDGITYFSEEETSPFCLQYSRWYN